MKKGKLINISILLIAIIAILFGVFFYSKLHKLQSNYSKQTPEVSEKQKAVEKEIDNLISKVSQIYLFPANETPTIATVSDPEVLKGKSFFTLSQKGDKVLLFAKAGKAVLYRPSINKIIDTVSIQSSLNNGNVTTNQEQKTN
jgi:hypothetical protein